MWPNLQILVTFSEEIRNRKFGKFKKENFKFAETFKKCTHVLYSYQLYI